MEKKAYNLILYQNYQILFVLIMHSQNPYLILQLSQQATTQQIRQRYLFLSKSLHPDKQSYENYELAKQYFEKIDRAYKSISSPLRIYIYSKYGSNGIYIFENNIHEFIHLENELNHEWAQKEIQQKMVFFYLQIIRQVQQQQSKTDGSSFIKITPAFKKNKMRNYTQIRKMGLAYSSVFPELFKLQNNYQISLQSASNQISSSLQLTSMRRIYNQILLKNVFQISQRGITNELQFSRTIHQNLVLKMTPINYNGQQFGPIKIGFQSSFENNIQLNMQTNLMLNQLNIHLSQRDKQKIKFLNFDLGQNSYVLGYQNNLSRDCQYFTHFVVMLAQNQNNQIEHQIGFHYGIKIKVTDSTKLQLKSLLSQKYNYFQISVIKDKYIMKIPLFIQDIPAINFETIKILIMISAYAIQRINYIIKNKQKSYIQKLLKQNYGRLTDERSSFVKYLQQNENRQQQIYKFQILSKGLVILTALYGNKRKLKNIYKRYFSKSLDVLQKEYIQNFNKFREMNINHYDTNQQEIIDVTKFIQLKVLGSKIQNQIIKIYNPCLDVKQNPQLYIKYYLRGKIYNKIFDLKKPLNIGTKHLRYQNPISDFIVWLKKLNII